MLGRSAIGTIGMMGGVENVPTGFACSLAHMAIYNERFLLQPTEEIVLLRAQQSYHATARNWLVAEMHGDWLLMLDTDHTFDANMLKRLLVPFEAKGLDVLTGVYFQRGEPFMPVLWRVDEKGDLTFLSGLPRSQIIAVDAAGAGCLLVRRRVFERIASELGEAPFDPFEGYSEDIAFFLRLRRLGIQAWAHTGVELKHLMQQAVGRAEHEACLPHLIAEPLEVAAL